MESAKRQRRNRLRRSVRKKVQGTAQRPRLSVFRSNRFIYAQLIDDIKGATLAAASTAELDNGKLNVETSKEVGKKMAQKAGEAGVKSVVFDRGGYVYHGNVKALAEGAREGGLKF